MSVFEVSSDPSVKLVLDRYPKNVRPVMDRLRKLVIDTAAESEDVDRLTETLKWGEPSFIAPKGSTIRMDWKERSPNQYALYFNCSSRLVPTFREVYNGLFRFEGKRAILFDLDQPLPEAELKRCLSVALRYHKVKHLPLLGL